MCDALTVIFGDRLQPAGTTAEAAWIDVLRAGAPGTVGALVPNHYEAYLRVHAPDPAISDWWAAYRELFGIVASVGSRYTARPGRCWFSIWDGHCFDLSAATGADGERRSQNARQSVHGFWQPVRAVDGQPDEATRSDLESFPRVNLPHRSYYVVEGPLAAVTDLRYPGSDEWRNPDLLWPQDRRWFVATDVDFWSLYVGGNAALIDDLTRAASVHTQPITLETLVESEL